MASKGTPGDAKCFTEISGGKFRGDKIVATRGEIFSLKFTKYRFAAGLRPDTLGQLKRSPISHSRNKGAYF